MVTAIATVRQDVPAAVVVNGGVLNDTAISPCLKCTMTRCSVPCFRK